LLKGRYQYQQIGHTLCTITVFHQKDQHIEAVPLNILWLFNWSFSIGWLPNIYDNHILQLH